jgi:hypothetical protein
MSLGKGMSDLVASVKAALRVDAEVTPWTLKGSGRLPKGWSRNYVHIRHDGATYHATKAANNHLYIRRGPAHRLSARDKTFVAKNHVHLTRDGTMRDGSGIASELKLAHSAAMKALPRTGLTVNALGRQVQIETSSISRGLVIANDTWKAAGFGPETASVFARQTTALTGLAKTSGQIAYSAKAMQKAVSTRPRGLSQAGRQARIDTLRLAGEAERAARTATTLSEKAATMSVRAGEKATAVAVAKAEVATARAAAAAEKLSREAAKEAEKAARTAAKAAEIAARQAAKASEQAVKVAAQATEAALQASAKLTEAGIRAAVYAAAATVATATGR